jgi:hypothetical protein
MDVARPTIPPEEYGDRWRRVQSLMQAMGLDLLVAYGNDRAVFGPAHVRWLADIPVHFEPMAVLVPPSGDPLVACGPESDQYALRVGRVPDVRVLREFTHPDEDYPFSRIETLAEIVAELIGPGRPVRRFGIAGLASWTRPHPLPSRRRCPAPRSSMSSRRCAACAPASPPRRSP